MLKDGLYKILIVDDVPGNIKALIAILSADYELIVATHGRQAIDIAQSEPVDLILLDVVMPGMDGYDVCKCLKTIDRTKNIPIIFLTSKNDAADETLALELGAVDFINKPANPPVVKARVKTHLGLKVYRETLERQNQELREASLLREDVDRIMRHDLKGPLNAIIGFSDFLRSSLTMDDSQREICELVIDAEFALLSMINLSLDLYKIERGCYELRAVAIDLLPVIDKIMRMNLGTIRVKGLGSKIFVNGSVRRPTDRFMIYGEELLCFSMFGNIIKNALEASPDGHAMTISMMSGETASILTHNAGSVPEEIRARFFEKYVTSGKSHGTGLGTYSARLMAETQNGSIDLDTSDENGTTITVRMPLAMEADLELPNESFDKKRVPV
ncbi:MAG: hybrid sensor histidine kinase/response regulator [Magnetococcales bacterium]|nr:hybrid sensor histidine kinase/response regulator [Magnetococcales bacterium]